MSYIHLNRTGIASLPAGRAREGVPLAVAVQLVPAQWASMPRSDAHRRLSDQPSKIRSTLSYTQSEVTCRAWNTPCAAACQQSTSSHSSTGKWRASAPSCTYIAGLCTSRSSRSQWRRCTRLDCSVDPARCTMPLSPSLHAAVML